MYQTHSILLGLCVSDIQGDEGITGSARTLNDGVCRTNRGEECDAGDNIDMARRPYITLCDSPPPGVLSQAEGRPVDSGGGASSADFNTFGVKLSCGSDDKLSGDGRTITRRGLLSDPEPVTENIGREGRSS